VKNLKSHDHGKTWNIIRESLQELDYEIFFKVCDGQDFVPQHRERLLIVGFDKRRYGSVIDFDFNYEKPKEKKALRDIIDLDVDSKYILSDKLWSYLQLYAERQKEKGNGFGYGMPSLDGISRTLSARYYKDGAEILISRGEGLNPRRLTPRECARLQGFPEEYKIVVSDVNAYRQFGNSVVVPLIEAVAQLLVAKMTELEKMRRKKPKGEKNEKGKVENLQLDGAKP